MVKQQLSKILFDYSKEMFYTIELTTVLGDPYSFKIESHCIYACLSLMSTVVVKDQIRFGTNLKF